MNNEEKAFRFALLPRVLICFHDALELHDLTNKVITPLPAPPKKIRKRWFATEAGTDRVILSAYEPWETEKRSGRPLYFIYDYYLAAALKSSDPKGTFCSLLGEKEGQTGITLASPNHILVTNDRKTELWDLRGTPKVVRRLEDLHESDNYYSDYEDGFLASIGNKEINVWSFEGEEEMKQVYEGAYALSYTPRLLPVNDRGQGVLPGGRILLDSRNEYKVLDLKGQLLFGCKYSKPNYDHPIYVPAKESSSYEKWIFATKDGIRCKVLCEEGEGELMYPTSRFVFLCHYHEGSNLLLFGEEMETSHARDNPILLPGTLNLLNLRTKKATKLKEFWDLRFSPDNHYATFVELTEDKRKLGRVLKKAIRSCLPDCLVGEVLEFL